MATSEIYVLTYIIIVFISIAQVPGVSGLECYACTFTQTDSTRDRECVDTPWNVSLGQPVMHCHYDYCTTFRQVLKASGKVRSFYRNCQLENPGNRCVSDHYFHTCFTTCSTDRCNHSNGIPRSIKSTRKRVLKESETTDSDSAGSHGGSNTARSDRKSRRKYAKVPGQASSLYSGAFLYLLTCFLHASVTQFV